MISNEVRQRIDKEIKDIWLHQISRDYGEGLLIKEASLQNGLYFHIRQRLGTFLKENNLYLYPEVYFKELQYFADLAIVEMNMSMETQYLGERITDVVAIIELKYDGGYAKSTEKYIKTDLTKLKNYVKNLKYDCQYYFGVIYETECWWLNFLDKRSTNHWAAGRVTELNAGYLEEEMIFEVNSYNGMNQQKEKAVCNIIWNG